MLDGSYTIIFAVFAYCGTRVIQIYLTPLGVYLTAPRQFVMSSSGISESEIGLLLHQKRQVCVGV